MVSSREVCIQNADAELAEMDRRKWVPPNIDHLMLNAFTQSGPAFAAEGDDGFWNNGSGELS